MGKAYSVDPLASSSYAPLTICAPIRPPQTAAYWARVRLFERQALGVFC